MYGAANSTGQDRQLNLGLRENRSPFLLTCGLAIQMPSLTRVDSLTTAC